MDVAVPFLQRQFLAIPQYDSLCCTNQQHHAEAEEEKVECSGGDDGDAYAAPYTLECYNDELVQLERFVQTQQRKSTVVAVEASQAEEEDGSEDFFRDAAFRRLTLEMTCFALVVSVVACALVGALRVMYFHVLRGIVDGLDANGTVPFADLANDQVSYGEDTLVDEWVLFYGVRAFATNTCGSSAVFLLVFALVPRRARGVIVRLLPAVAAFIVTCTAIDLAFPGFIMPGNPNLDMVWGINITVYVALFGVFITVEVNRVLRWDFLTRAVVGTWFTTVGTNFVFLFVLIPAFIAHSDNTWLSILYGNVLMPLVSKAPLLVASTLGQKLPPSTGTAVVVLNACPVITLALFTKFLMMNLSGSGSGGGVWTVTLYSVLISLQEAVFLVLLRKIEIKTYYYMLIGCKQRERKAREMAGNIHRQLQRGALIIMDLVYDLIATLATSFAIWIFNITLVASEKPDHTLLIVSTLIAVGCKFLVWVGVARVYKIMGEPISTAWVVFFEHGRAIMAAIACIQTTFVFCNTMGFFCPRVMPGTIFFEYCQSSSSA